MVLTDWEIVSMAWEECAEECGACEYFAYDYSTDLGAQSDCTLGDIPGHDPKWCPAYERVLEELK